MYLRLHRFMLDDDDNPIPRDKCPRLLVPSDHILYIEEDADDGSTELVLAHTESVYVCEGIDEISKAVQEYWES